MKKKNILSETQFSQKLMLSCGIKKNFSFFIRVKKKKTGNMVK